jgi:hypothetical protein
MVIAKSLLSRALFQAEQEKKVAAEREKIQARLREEQEKKAELRGQYAGDKSARKEEGWKAQVRNIGHHA